MTRIPDRVREALVEETGAHVASATAVGGGCINDAYRVELSDGTTLFVKTHPSPPADFFAIEAEGLRWIARTRTVRVPEVVCHGDCYLALEWIEPGHPRPGTWAEFGEALAGLHSAPAHGHGWHRDGFIGDLPQPNAPAPDWTTFWLERRIRPLTLRAVGEGLLPQSTLRMLDDVGDALVEILGPDVRCGPLHGDLWSGNAMVDHTGSVVVVDPAPYAGDPDVDVAMMSLFGGFPPECLHAHDAAIPPREGRPLRIAAYQIYPLLVHTVLFGSSYAERALATLRRIAS
ncbi:MAG: fructosamine kinase [Acidimicrobiales bacterium]|nr:MAG: fructosamine kinase [Acidimicrobiales bacterium]